MKTTEATITVEEALAELREMCPGKMVDVRLRVGPNAKYAAIEVWPNLRESDVDAEREWIIKFIESKMAGDDFTAGYNASRLIDDLADNAHRALADATPLAESPVATSPVPVAEPEKLSANEQWIRNITPVAAPSVAEGDSLLTDQDRLFIRNVEAILKKYGSVDEFFRAVRDGRERVATPSPVEDKRKSK